MSGSSFKNADGKPILSAMADVIAKNKAYLSEIDGLVGDGDHGVNMHKGFSRFAEGIEGKNAVGFSEGLDALANILLTEIGGSMGPIYGTIFMSMAEACGSSEDIDAPKFLSMLEKARDDLYDIVQARPGDKTLVDALVPAIDAFAASSAGGGSFSGALDAMKAAAERGRDSTTGMIAKYGRSRALGERSRGVTDAGSASCCMLLSVMGDEICRLLK
jgi:dihydroxyacetone kinase-like protein